MQHPTRPYDEEQRHRDNTRVEEAVNAILKKLKRGRPVRLPGIGSLLPGAPPRFQSLADDKPAPPRTPARKSNAKR